jgi:O-acetyl-ADP-ribose deacetylase (regulator of RNase III)
MNIVTGNLLTLAYEGEFDVIVQGCNCFNAMGGGIAREIAQRFPEAALEDKKTTKGDYDKLGNYTRVEIDDFFVIVNAYTQYAMSNGEDVFEYDAFKLILQKLARRYPTARFGFPLIGMGLANGNKTRIMGMLSEFSEKITETGGTFTLVEFG